MSLYKHNSGHCPEKQFDQPQFILLGEDGVKGGRLCDVDPVSVWSLQILVYILLCLCTGIAAASGMAATTQLCQLLKSGDHVVAMDDLYGGKEHVCNSTNHLWNKHTNFKTRCLCYKNNPTMITFVWTPSALPMMTTIDSRLH